MLLRTAYTFALAALVTGAALAASSQFRIKAGQWEFTRTITSNWERGTPAALKDPTEIQKRCIGRREGLLAQPKHRGCRFVEKKFADGVVQATEQCDQAGKVATYRYSGQATRESFDLVERLTVIEAGAAVQETETQFSARWVGPCGAS